MTRGRLAACAGALVLAVFALLAGGARGGRPAAAPTPTPAPSHRDDRTRLPPPTCAEPCMYDAKAGRTRKCQHLTQDGRCGHFGVPCSAADLRCGRRAKRPGPACLFDPSDGSYKQCTQVAAGRCAHFRAPCSRDDLTAQAGGREPLCLYDPKHDGHRSCDQVTATGRCVQYGIACAP